MKKNNFYLAIFAIAVLLTGCKGDDESKQHYTNKVFISATSFNSEVRVERADKEMSRQLVLGMAKPESFDITATFKAAPELLDRYRQAFYDPDVLLLPSIHYDLSDATTSIREGKVSSDPITLEFTNLDQLDLDEVYVLPVTIATIQGIGVLESAKTIYYVFKESSLVNVVADMNSNRSWPDWKDTTEVSNMETFTLEALIFGRTWSKESSEISTIMGIEDIFLIRVGDSNLPSNQLQVAYAVKDEVENTTRRGDVTSSALQLQPQQWYHIAVTFDKGAIIAYLDGREIATGDASALGVTSIHFGTQHSDEADGKPRCFWVGYSYDDKRYLNGYISEARIWNKALTSDEINEENHFYRVDPASEGLVAYWKFDDGAGGIVKDHTSYGNDLQSERDLGWVSVALPEKNKK